MKSKTIFEIPIYSMKEEVFNAIEINMIEYPSYKTEQIMKRIINKSNVKKLDF